MSSISDTKNIFSVYEAKAKLSRLITLALSGEEIVISRNKQPLVKIVPFQANKPRQLGLLAGQVKIADDFNSPLPDEILADFEGPP